LVRAHYRIGPDLADVVGRSELLRRAVRVLPLPLLGFSSLCL